MPPAYSAAAAAWVKAGGIWITAGVRGGGDRGHDWHEAGRGRLKLNAVRDLEAIADRAVAAGLTTNEQLGLHGGSFGGLVVGAAARRRPANYRAIVLANPLVDVNEFHHTPHGKHWIHELGNPDSPDDAAALAALDPFPRTTTTRMPWILATCGAGDIRVDPLRAARLIAAWNATHTGTQRRAFILTDSGGHIRSDPEHAIQVANSELKFLASHLHLGPRAGSKCG